MNADNFSYSDGGRDETTRTDSCIEPLEPSFAVRNGVIAGFTTRRGGVSKPPFDSLNLGRGTPDNPDDVERNHALLYKHLGVERENVALMGQVHGNAVRTVDTGGVSLETDGLITASRGILLGVVTADCVPLLLYSPPASSIAAVHCGWRPIAKGIVETAVAILVRDFGADPAGILAASGPSAGGCCYQVGDDVVEALDPSSIEARRDGRYADLRHELRLRLNASGLADENIETVGGCSICSPDQFYSYRRNGGQSGRMIGYIMLR